MSGAGIVAGGSLGVHAELRHEAGAHVVVVKVSAHTQLRQLDFAGAEYLAGAANCVVAGAVEVINVRRIRANLGCKELAVECSFFRASIAVEPTPVTKCERLSRFVVRGNSGGWHRRGILFLYE